MRKMLSTTKEAVTAIRAEISHFYGYDMTGLRKSALEAMRADADAYNCGDAPSRSHSDWQKGAGLVDAGCFRCYHNDQAEFLRNIYGEQVDRWNGDRIHRTYANLIGREYARMIREAK